MANTSAILAQLLALKTQENIYTMDQIRWATKYESNAERLSDQEGYRDKWETKYDDAYSAEPDKELKAGGRTFMGSNTAGNAGRSKDYAYAAVPKYDPDAYDHYANLDIQYDTIKTTYETILEELSAEKEALQGKLSEAAGDTGLLDS